MASPNDVEMAGAESSRNEPFTIEENIRQLNAIDQQIIQLMKHTATALNALTISKSTETDQSIDPSAEPAKPSLDPGTQKEAFASATDQFFGALHTVDVKIKRQIMALEEANIISLAPPPRLNKTGPIIPQPTPNGVGAVGNIGAGWLNSRGTRVERDMEAELWGKAKEILKEKEAKLESESR
ncbi:hypothetical protein H9Q69_009133 [Fusarium xylarioides]|uniref:Mediator of RNA polymerase II transcription subunit 11 n=1 Tax=Fusarium xylarioides TaxID=221167 RepID=A0A9P7HQ20_9HYPO|nr:hypothetical protein H9Q72_008170 [Fusarium xylarioides]KAG5791827.1 hypothetical protein H9Q69_009133 [Fusarium xylarioides]